MYTRESVHSWAELIIDQLGPPKGFRVWVEDTEGGHDIPAKPAGNLGAYSSIMQVEFDDDAGHAHEAMKSHTSSFTVWVDIPGSGQAGVIVDGDEPKAALLARLADQFQDYVLESTGGAPNPPCPEHQHPLMADVVDGVAVWRCPRESRRGLRPILTVA